MSLLFEHTSYINLCPSSSTSAYNAGGGQDITVCPASLCLRNPPLCEHCERENPTLHCRSMKKIITLNTGSNGAVMQPNVSQSDTLAENSEPGVTDQKKQRAENVIYCPVAVVQL